LRGDAQAEEEPGLLPGEDRGLVVELLLLRVLPVAVPPDDVTAAEEDEGQDEEAGAHSLPFGLAFAAPRFAAGVGRLVAARALELGLAAGRDGDGEAPVARAHRLGARGPAGLLVARELEGVEGPLEVAPGPGEAVLVEPIEPRREREGEAGALDVGLVLDVAGAGELVEVARVTA